MYLGTGTAVPDDLAKARAAARQARIAANRALKCEDCRLPPAQAESPVVPSVLQLRHPDSRMSVAAAAL